jgi:hypothetical protein
VPGAVGSRPGSGGWPPRFCGRVLTDGCRVLRACGLAPAICGEFPAGARSGG